MPSAYKLIRYTAILPKGHSLKQIRSPTIPPLSMVDLRQGAAIKGYCLLEVCQIEGAETPRPWYRTGLITKSIVLTDLLT